MQGPSWGVVATIDEPAALAVAFAGYHLGIGAGEVHVFLDQADPETAAALGALPGCHVTLCDSAYWAASAAGARPRGVNRRQAVNAQAVYDRARVDWLLHADADEYVADGAALAAALAAAPQGARALRLRTLERVWRAGQTGETVFAGVFRRAAPDFGQWGEAVHGRWAKFLKDGLTGHTQGKTIARRAAGLSLGIHFVRDAAGALVEDAVLDDMLLHFDGLTPRHFLLKLAARLELEQYNAPNNPDGAARDRQARFVRNNLAEGHKLAGFAAGLQSLSPELEAALAARGTLDERRFDPRPAMARVAAVAELTPATFDAALAARHAALIAARGLTLPEPPP